MTSLDTSQLCCGVVHCFRCNHMDEAQFKTLRELAKDSTLSQRDLARRMGMSLGRVNYLVNALLNKGYIKAQRFKNAKNKIAYMYILTPRGVSEKITQTYAFLQRKLEEYDSLKVEIETLRQENHEDLRDNHKNVS